MASDASYRKDRARRDRERVRAEKHRIEIRVWMLRNGFACKDVAKGAKVSDQLLSLFMVRQGRNPRIIEFLTSKGCPAEHFEDNMVKADRSVQ